MGLARRPNANEIFQLPIINTDQTAADLSPDAPERTAITAGRLSLSAAQNALDLGESFAIETTLSGQAHLRMAARAKRGGRRIGLIYVCVASAEIAVNRVRQRHRSGGHNVPPDDVRRRYSRSLANLPSALRLADYALIFDNTGREGHIRILEVRRGTIVFRSDRLPGWVTEALSEMPSPE